MFSVLNSKRKITLNLLEVNKNYLIRKKGKQRKETHKRTKGIGNDFANVNNKILKPQPRALLYNVRFIQDNIPTSGWNEDISGV